MNYRLLSVMLFITSLTTTITTAYSQTKGKDFCQQGTMTDVLLEDPEKAAQIHELDDELEAFTQNFEKVSQRSSRANTYVIPVVFHVLHVGGEENISDAQIYDQMRILNLDFNMLNEDLADVVSSFEGIIGDAEITFELAQIDPDGNSTDGIDRINSSETNVGDDGSKLNQWAPTMYLNVWTVDQINGATGAAAYAYLPASAAAYPSIDGIIINHRYIGSIGTSQESRQHTLSHEIGHYLNLKHTWGSTNSPEVSTNCSDDDGVTDTPNCIGTSGSCDLSQISCGSLDNVQNIMDYASCDRMFTEGQVSRMHATLNSAVAGRSNLWSSSNLTNVGLNELVSSNFSADDQVIPESETVNFMDKSQYAITSWAWNFQGGDIQTSTDEDPSVYYNGAGSYDVILTATKGNGSLTTTKENYIMVVPEIGHSVPMTESFEENGVEFWHPNENQVMPEYGWVIDETNGVDGDACMKMNNFGADEGLYYELESTTYDLSVYTTATLTFKYAYARQTSSDLDRITVYASTDFGETWTSRLTQIGPVVATGGTVTSSYTPSSSDWTTASFNITGTSLADAVQFKFEFETGGGNNYYIDDIEITGTNSTVAQLRFPYDGMDERGSNTVLDWQPMSCDEYELQYDTDPNFSNPVSVTQSFIDLTDDTDSEYEATGLTPSETYYWRVRLVVSSVEQTWSDVWSFTVAEDGVGIDDATDENSEISLYPNPANGEVTLQINANQSSATTVQVFDVFGKLVTSQNTEITSGTNNIQFNTQAWKSGVYMVVVNSDEGNSIKKLVVSH